MIEILPPTSPLDCTLSLPGSKYVANRVLPIAALAGGDSRLLGLPDNDDITHTLAALQALGVRTTPGNLAPELVVHGTGGRLTAPSHPIDVGASGTLMRFVTALCSLAEGSSVITGCERLRQRPVGSLCAALRGLGVEVEDSAGTPPVTVRGGKLPGGSTGVEGEVSSQFLSALLLISPLAQSSCAIELYGALRSASYVDLTVATMAEFGVTVERSGQSHFLVAAPQVYTPRTYRIPTDWSSAGYFFAAAAISGGTVTVTELDLASTHGERGLLGVLASMGCALTQDNCRQRVTVTGTSQLQPVRVSMTDMPDSLQTAAVVASFARGPSRFCGVAHLRHKESNRLGDTATELRRLGVEVEVEDDALVVHGNPDRLHGATLETHGDHRMAMSLALFGLRVPGLCLSGEDCVAKSFPSYFETLASIGVGLRHA